LKQSRARTVRLEADLDDAIARLAREDRVSLSQVANKALRRYVEWDRAPTNRGMVSVPSMLLVKLMAELSGERALELGRWAGKELFLPNLKAGYPTLSLERAEQMMRMLGSYGGRFTFDHGVEGGRHVITMGQKLGRNWSAYYAGALETIFEKFLGKATRVMLSDNMCVVEFKGRPPV
jgi:hypothetical protein